MRRVAAAVLLVLVSGCSREPASLNLTGEQLMLHSLLLAGSDTVQVLLTRTPAQPLPDPANPAGFAHSLPVSGAGMRLKLDGRTIQLREAPEGFPPCFSAVPNPVLRGDSIRPGCYAAVLPERVQPGQQYRLEAQIGEERVEGSTRVPESPEILLPMADAQLPVFFQPSGEDPALSAMVRWRAPPVVAGVSLGLALDSVYRAGRRERGSRCAPEIGEPEIYRTQDTDSARLVVQRLYCIRGAPAEAEVFTPDSVFGRIVLAGYDSSFVSYAEAAAQYSAKRERLQAGITGALGVFAGAAITTRPVVLIPRR